MKLLLTKPCKDYISSARVDYLYILCEVETVSKRAEWVNCDSDFVVCDCR